MAMVRKYIAEVIAVKQSVEGVFTVDLETTGKPFQFYPGQFLHIALDEYDPTSGWPESRCFSMQTPPGNKMLRITYAVKGAFTQRMAVELMKGRLVTLKMPYGDLFLQDHNKNHTIFIAGGTGITPFLSLFNDDSFKTYHKPLLFAGFRFKAMNFYQDELKKAAEINPSFNTHFYYENENGLINSNDLLAENWAQSFFFISGPPDMIVFYKNAIQSRGIQPERIKTDDWE